MLHIAAAATLLFLTVDPLLPAGVVPAPWPPDQLRTAYAEFESAFQSRLRRFLVAA